MDQQGCFISAQYESARLVHWGLEGQLSRWRAQMAGELVLIANWGLRWARELRAPVTFQLGLAMDGIVSHVAWWL